MEMRDRVSDRGANPAFQGWVFPPRVGVSWGAIARKIVVGAVLMMGCGEGDRQGVEQAEEGVAGTDSLLTGQETTPPPADPDDPGTPEGSPGADAAGVAAPLGIGDPMEGAASADAFRTYRIPAGTRIRVALDEEVSTDVYRPGDAVVATVAAAVTDGAGAVLIPRGAKLLGRIVTAAGSQGVGEAPVLEIYFETLSALNAEWPVEGAVVSAPVELDAQAEAMRRLSRSRSGRDTEVPGEIAAGAEVEVELRAPVRVSPMVVPADSLLPGDSVPGRDTVPVSPRRPAALLP